jgi:hypothetical protein
MTDLGPRSGRTADESTGRDPAARLRYPRRSSPSRKAIVRDHASFAAAAS